MPNKTETTPWEEIETAMNEARSCNKKMKKDVFLKALTGFVLEKYLPTRFIPSDKELVDEISLCFGGEYNKAHKISSYTCAEIIKKDVLFYLNARDEIRGTYNEYPKQ